MRKVQGLLGDFRRLWQQWQAKHRETYAQQVLADSPLAYWRLGETDGTVAHDSSGHENHGVYMGRVELGIPGMPGTDGDKALRLRHSTAFVALPEGLDRLVNDFTVEAWYNNAQIGTYFVQIMGHKNIHEARFNLGRWPDNRWKVSKYSAADIFLGTVPGDMDWHQVVLVFSSTEGTLLYQDGVLSGQAPNCSDLEPERPFPRLGVAEQGPHWGDLDEVAIYPHALAPERILAHYRKGIKAGAWRRPRQR